jgi:hypothetical protein
MSAATNKCATVEEPLEAVSSTCSVPRLYEEDHLDKQESLAGQSEGSQGPQTVKYKNESFEVARLPET